MDHFAVRGAPALAKREGNSVFGCRAADASLELTGAETIEQASRCDGILHHSKRAAVAVRQDRFGTRFGDDRLPAAANLSQCLIPVDALPLTGTLRTGAAQR